MTVSQRQIVTADSLKIERTPVKRGKTSPLLYGADWHRRDRHCGRRWFFWPDSRAFPSM